MKDSRRYLVCVCVCVCVRARALYCRGGPTGSLDPYSTTTSTAIPHLASLRAAKTKTQLWIEPKTEQYLTLLTCRRRHRRRQETISALPMVGCRFFGPKQLASPFFDFFLAVQNWFRSPCGNILGLFNFHKIGCPLGRS